MGNKKGYYRPWEMLPWGNTLTYIITHFLPFSTVFIKIMPDFKTSNISIVTLIWRFKFMPLITFTEGQAIKASETNANNQYLKDLVQDSNTALNTLISNKESSLNSAITNSRNLSSPVGMIAYYAKGTAPSGWLICNGSAVSRTEYADLFAKISTTYGSGNGSTTFNLPNLINKFPQGNTTVGTVKEAGLPNIIGNTGINVGGSPTSIEPSGAFGKNGDKIKSETGAAYSTTIKTIDFDASRSSSIYGNSSTVQPPALTLLPMIKY